MTLTDDQKVEALERLAAQIQKDCPYYPAKLVESAMYYYLDKVRRITGAEVETVVEALAATRDPVLTSFCMATGPRIRRRVLKRLLLQELR